MSTGILNQVDVAKAHLGISFFTVLGGGFPCLSAYVITHHALPQLFQSTDQIDRFRFYGLLPVVAACLAYSVRTVSQWGLQCFGDAWKTRFLIVALEGVMVLVPIPPLALGALAILVTINAIATTSTLIAEKPEMAEGPVSEAAESPSLPFGATSTTSGDRTQGAPPPVRDDPCPSACMEPPVTVARLRAVAASDGAAVRRARAVRPARNAPDLYESALAFVEKAGKCSISALQRQLGVGYNSAAKLVERMERDGVVGPAEAGGRQLLRPAAGEACAVAAGAPSV